MRPLLVLILAVSALGCRCSDKVGRSTAAVRFQPASVTLGPTWVGDAVEETVVLKNDSVQPLTVTLQVEGPFSIDVATVELAGTGATPITVRFPAAAAGMFFGRVIAVDLDAELELIGIAEDVPSCTGVTQCRSSAFDKATRACVETLIDDGSSCAVSDPCMQGGTCRQGSCAANTRSCPAATDPCKAAACDPEFGCVFQPVADGMSCGVADCSGAHVCRSGLCTLEAGTAPPNCRSHPSTPWRKIMMSSPFGLATDLADFAYVARPGAGLVTRIDTVQAVAAGDVTTGQLPTGVTMDSTTLYVANQGSSSLTLVDRGTFSALPPDIMLGMSAYIPAVDGNFVYVSGATSDVKRVDRGTRTLAGSLSGTWAHANGIAFHPTQGKMYVSARDTGEVTEIDLATFAVGRRFSPGSGPQQMVISANGNELYLAREYGALGIIDTNTGLLIAEVMNATGGFGLAMTPDGAELYLTRPASGDVVRVDIASRAVVGTISTGGTPRRVGFSSNGTVAVITNEQGWVDLIR